MAKAKPKDFAKVKLKVGRKLEASNTTKTEFKAKKVVVRATQGLAADPVHCLTACSTSSPSVKLLHLNKLITSPVLSTPHCITGHLLNALARLVLDSDQKVRKQARVCVQQALTCMSAEQLHNSVSLLLPHVKCGLTHLVPAVVSESRELLSFLIGRSSADHEQSFVQIIRTRVWDKKSVSLLDLELAAEILTKFKRSSHVDEGREPRLAMVWDPRDNYVPWSKLNKPRLSLSVHDTCSTPSTVQSEDEVLELLRKVASDGLVEFSSNSESRSSITVEEGRRLVAFLQIGHCLSIKLLLLPEYTVVGESSKKKRASTLNHQIRDLRNRCLNRKT